MGGISFLKKKSGIFDPTKRYSFTNITNDLFTFHWDKKPISVKANQSIELPEHLALKATEELVDKIILNEAKKDTDEGREKTNNFYYRSRIGTQLGNPGARKVYEDQILKELQVDEESPQIAVIRAEIKEQLLKDLENGQKSPADISSIISEVRPDNFAETRKKGEFPGLDKK